MINPNELSSATVAELREFAKARGIALGTLRTKAQIMERIQEALEEAVQALAPTQPADKAPAAAPQPERRAMIIADDEHDDAAPPRTPPRPAPSKPQTTSTGKNKPAFTLEGARAWHNPQPFTASQPPPSRYAPTLSQQVTTLSGQQGADGTVMPVRPVQRVSRFGPDAAQAPDHAAVPLRPTPATAAPQSYRPTTYVPPVVRPQPATPAAEPDAGIAAYRRPVPDFSAVEPARMAPPVPAAKEPLARETAGLNPAVPEMLATGDCGDGCGVLEIHSEGYGFLRAGNFLPGKHDVYVSNAQIRRFGLRDGDLVEGKTRPQREGDRYAALLYITKINGHETDEQPKRRDFDELTPIYPQRRINLSSATERDPVLRFIDLFAPIGFGQRALIVAPPKAGKTTIIKKIALSVKQQQPDAHLMLLLVDERPEEVTDLKETVGGDVFYSTFDEPAESHARVSELVMQRAMRLVEGGRDVVILMDSLTRLSRAYNTIAPNTARIMSGGLAAGALHKPKRFFGAARNLKEGGSITIIATCIVDTGSRMDEVIYEEFKGTGNMELTLDRALQELRLFPAVSILKSGTRQEGLLLSPAEMDVANKVRVMISGASEHEGIAMVLSMMEKTKDNEDFVARFDQWAQMMGRR